ncbi:MAG: FG-GAP repeat protein, partial [Verrucomicrobiae bacterium]|nr:FG-GAP repeat protein [Verrucomicrobiae bacterium]
NLESVTFQNNATAYNGTAVIQGTGGAIYNSDQATVNITGASVIQNNLAATGAGISNASNGSVVNITGTESTNVLIQGNWARADGGGLRNGNELSAFNLTYVTIQNNIAEASDGGGIANQNGILRGDHVTIHNNAAGTGDGHDGGGIFAVNRSDIVFTNSVISNNVAGDDGGGVYVQTSPVQVRFENSVITGNRTGIDHRTGTTYVDGANTPGNITVLGDVTTASTSTHTAADGGGIYAIERANIILINSSVTDNTSSGAGGGILITNDAQLSVSGSLISGNMAGFTADGTVFSGNRHGGGLYAAERAILTLNASVVKDNVAVGQGGGLYQIGESLATISGTTFEANIAGREGGAYYQTNTNTRSNVSNTTFTGNQAGVITDTTFLYLNYDTETSGNVATDLAVGQTVTTATGSGVIIYRGQNTNSTTAGTILLSNVTGTFANNQLLDNGVVGNTALVNGTFPQDLGDGGAVYMGGGVMNLVHTTVTGNFATDQGGGIRRNSGTLNFLNSVASNNDGRTAALDDLDGTIAATTSFEGAATLTAATGITVGASLAGGAGSTTVQDTMTIFNPDSGDTNIVGAVTTELLASDQNGGGRGGSAAPSDRGAIELNPLTSAITLDSLSGPSNWISGTSASVMEFSAVASSLGTGGGDLRFSWSVSGGTASVPSSEVDITSPGLGEESSFSFTHTITDAETSSETLTVTVTITDLTTGQTVTQSRDVRVINPDAMPTTPVATFVVTTTTDAIESTPDRLSFDTGTASFVVGETLTGGTTGATAQIVAILNVSGTPGGGDEAGTLVLKTLSGTFADDEVITSASGAALANGANFTDVDLISLREAITAANASAAGDVVITFDPSLDTQHIVTTIAATNEDANANGDFDITKTNGAIIIAGNGIANTIIDGGGIDRVFHIFAGRTLFLKDLTVTGGVTVADDHGAGFINEGGTVVLNNVDISGNQALRGPTNLTDGAGSNVGGGFYVTNSGILGGTVVMKGGSITGNVSNGHGGGFYASGNNGSTTSVFLDGVTISSNTSINEHSTIDRDGGGFYFTGQSNVLYVKDSTIVDNAARDDGGGFFIAGEYQTVTFDNVTIQRNVVEGAVQDNDPNTSFNAVSFHDATNSGRDGGGGVIETTNSNVTFLGGLIGGDRAAEDSLEYDTGTAAFTIGQTVTGGTTGATATIDDIVVIDGTKGVLILSNIVGNFQNNEALTDGLGGAALADGTVQHRIGDGNYADNNGAGIYVRGNSNVTFEGTVIRGNFAEDSGAGLAVDGPSTVTFNGGSITDNFTIDEHGGGIAVFSGTFNATGTNITDNTAGDRIYNADPGDRVGGAMYITGGGRVNLVDINLSGNQAEGRGGAIYADRASIVTITSSVPDTKSSFISDNRTIENSTTASRGGAAFWITHAGTTINITDALVENNRSADDGGAFFLQGASTVNLTQVDITGNESNNGGGAIFLESDQSTVNLDTVLISGNAARVSSGGGIFTNGSVNAVDVIIQGNKTGYDLDTGQVASGSNDRAGGGIYIAGSEASFVGSNVVIIENETYGRGGGVWISDGKLELENFIIRDNQTNSNGNFDRGRGGGVYGETISTILLTNGEISDNRAEGHGGGIYQTSDGSRTVLTNVTVSGNIAGYDPDTGGIVTIASDGGGIALSTSGGQSLVLDHVTIANNQAAQNGGGVNRGGGSVTYRNSILFGNTRDVDTAAPFQSDNNGSATIEGVVIIGFNQGGTLTQTSGTRILNNPLLGALADNGSPVLPGGYTMRSHTLGTGSVAIDGAVGSVLAEDQRGATRAIGVAADIGALEVSQPELDAVVFDQTAINDGDTVTLTGDVLFSLLAGETQRSVTVEVDWGDGSPKTRLSFGAGFDYSAATPDFTFTHQYGTGLTGSHTATVSLGFTGSDAVLDTFTQVITVTDKSALTGTTNEDTPLVLNPTNSGVISTGSLNLDDELHLQLLNRSGWAVDIDGDWAVIGSEGNTEREEVYVYHFTGGSWSLEQILTKAANNESEIEFDDFGYSVNVDAVNGRIFIGSQLDDSGGTDKGAVYFFQFNGTAAVGAQWEFKQKIQATAAQGSDASDQFGSSLDSSGDVLIIGAVVEDADTLAQNDVAGANDSGAAYVFNFNGTTGLFEFAQKLKAQNSDGSPDIGGGDNFGRAVAIDGNRLVVGAELNDDTGTSSGSAYVYKFNGSLWEIEAKLAASNQGGDDRYGFDVDIQDGVVAVGARQEDIVGTNRGAVYVYTFEGSTVGAVIGAGGDSDRVRVISTNTIDTITISYVNAGPSQTLSVVEAGGTVTVTLATDGAGTITSTANDVATALNGLVLTGPNGGALLATAASHASGVGVVSATAGPITLANGYELTEISSVQIPGMANEDRLGGSVALDEVGGTIRLLTAAYQAEPIGGTNESGRGVLMELNLTTGLFELKQTFFPAGSDNLSRDEFGLSVALSGDNYLVGARLADGVFTTDDGANIQLLQRGTAYVFSGDPGSAVQVASLDGGIADGSATILGGFTEYGRRVAIAGDYAVVGSPQDGKEIANNTDQRTGRAYVFHRNDNGTTDTSDDTWSLIATLAPPTTDDDDGDFFGFAVSISEDLSTIAVGAVFHEAGGTNQGAVYVYSFDSGTGTATLEGRIRAAARNDSDEFARHLALNEDGSILAVGMRGDDDLDAGSGSVHVYNAAGGDWNAFFSGAATEQGVLSVNSDGIKLKPISDKTDVDTNDFGRSVAISGNRLVIGADGDDFPDDNSASGTWRDRGSVYVFELDSTNLHGLLDLDAPVEGNGKAQIAVHATIASGIT